MPRLRATKPDPNRLLGIADQVSRMTAGEPEPLKFRGGVLDEDEQRDLIRLWREALKSKDTDAERWSLDNLSDSDRARVESLVEKGSGKPHFFQECRDQATLGVEMRRMGEEVRRPPQFLRRKHPPGTLVLPPSLAEHIKKSRMRVTTLGVLVWTTAQLESGRAVLKGSVIEGIGLDAKLVIDRRRGFSGRGIGETPNWRGSYLRLRELGWLTVEENGPLMTVGLGDKLKKQQRAKR